MSIKLKVLGLGLLAVLATSAFAVMNASATTPANSHFTAEPPAGDHHVIIKGTDAFGSPHQLVFHPDTGGDGITCTHAEYHGTVSGAASTTTQAIQVRPTYKNCATTSGTWGEVTVDVPTACGTNVYEFTSGTPGTVHVNCEITITHPNCTIKVPKQTLNPTINHYTTGTRLNKHDITLDFDAHVTSHYEGGICIFLGTTHTSTMTGNSTVWGEDTNGNPIGITAT